MSGKVTVIKYKKEYAHPHQFLFFLRSLESLAKKKKDTSLMPFNCLRCPWIEFSRRQGKLREPSQLEVATYASS